MTVPNNAAAFAVGSGAIQPTGTSKSEECKSSGKNYKEKCFVWNEASTIRMESKM